MKGFISGTCRQHHGDKREEPRAGGVGGRLTAAAPLLSRVSWDQRLGEGTEGTNCVPGKGDSRAKGISAGHCLLRERTCRNNTLERFPSHSHIPSPGSLGSSPQTPTLHLSGCTATPSHLVLLSTQSNPVKAEMDGRRLP